MLVGGPVFSMQGQRGGSSRNALSAESTVRILPVNTPCWRPGCTLRMINGFDHPGLCNVVCHSPRRCRSRRRAASFSLLDELPTDLLILIFSSALEARSLLDIERCSRRCRDTARCGATLVWRGQLERLLRGTTTCAEAARRWGGLHPAAAAPFELELYTALHGPLEAKGWADASAVNNGEMFAWWRCVAVEIDLASVTAPRVKVRYDGYKPDDDEWRRPWELRRAVSLKLDAEGLVKEMLQGAAPPAVQIEWAVPGHPVALWEATVQEVVRPAGSGTDWARCQVRIRFEGHADDEDEVVPVGSRRLRPAMTEGQRPSILRELRDLCAPQP